MKVGRLGACIAGWWWGKAGVAVVEKHCEDGRSYVKHRWQGIGWWCRQGEEGDHLSEAGGSDVVGLAAAVQLGRWTGGLCYCCRAGLSRAIGASLLRSQQTFCSTLCMERACRHTLQQ